MALLPGDVENFNTLMKAAREGDLALLECQDAKTKEYVATICFVNQQNNEFEFVPVARMFFGNPYKCVIPPSLEESDGLIANV